MRRRGTTLIETLIAAGLFLLALVLCGQLSVLGMRSQSTTVDKNQAFRLATNGLNILDKDLAQTSAIYLPSALSGTAFFPTAHSGTVLYPNGSAPLVLQSSSIDGGATVPAYWLDSQTGELMRALYDPGFNVTNPSSQVLAAGQRPRVIATWISAFAIYGLDASLSYGARMLETQLAVSTVAPGTKGPLVNLQALTRMQEL